MGADDDGQELVPVPGLASTVADACGGGTPNNSPAPSGLPIAALQVATDDAPETGGVGAACLVHHDELLPSTGADMGDVEEVGVLASAAPTVWTPAQALAVISATRVRLVRALTIHAGLPVADLSLVMVKDGAPFYKCRPCAVRVSLERGALATHFLSRAHLRAPLGVVKGSGARRAASSGVPALPAPEADAAAVPAGPDVRTAASADHVGTVDAPICVPVLGATATDVGGSCSAQAAPASAGDASFATAQSAALRDLGILDAHEQRWWRKLSDNSIECTMCKRVIYGGGNHRSSLAVRVSEHRGTAAHNQQCQSRRGQSVLSFRQVPSPVMTEAQLMAQTVDRLLLNTRLWCRGYAEEEIVYTDRYSGEVQFVGSPMAIFDVLVEYPVDGMQALKRYGVISTPHYRSEGCCKSPCHLPTLDQVRRGVQSLVCTECAAIPHIPAFKKRLQRAAQAASEGRVVGARGRCYVGGYPTSEEKSAFIKEMVSLIHRLKVKV